MNRIVESLSNDEIKAIEGSISGKSNEFGDLGFVSKHGEYFIVFRFKDTDIIDWGVKNITDKFLSDFANVPNGFVSKIKETVNVKSFVLPIELSLLKGKNVISIIHGSSVIKGSGDKTVVMSPKNDISKPVFELLGPVFAWVKLCKKLYDFNRLDIDIINDLFSEAFDDAEDYAINIINVGGLNRGYEIAISTRTRREGGYIDIDDEILNLLKDIPNIIAHLEEYDINIAFNTTRPSRDRFKGKNETFYQAQAIVIRILPGKVYNQNLVGL